jgi:hypothetical protein
MGKSLGFWAENLEDDDHFATFSMLTNWQLVLNRYSNVAIAKVKKGASAFSALPSIIITTGYLRSPMFGKILASSVSVDFT